jgi:hypothetical protein
MYLSDPSRRETVAEAGKHEEDLLVVLEDPARLHVVTGEPNVSRDPAVSFVEGLGTGRIPCLKFPPFPQIDAPPVRLWFDATKPHK